MSTLFSLPGWTAVNQAGTPYARAKLFFYAAGTDTPQTTYQDLGLNTPHDHPVRSDDAGRFPAIYLNPDVAADYRAVLRTSNDVLIPGCDWVIPRSDIDTAEIIAEIRSGLHPVEQVELDNGITPTNLSYPLGHWVRYGADPTGAADSTAAINSSIAAITVTNFAASHGSYDTGGTYRIDGTITIPDAKQVRMSGNTKLLRKASASASTAPVVHVKGNYSVFDGGHGWVWSENDSPKGVICAGHLDQTTSAWNSVWQRVLNVNVYCKDRGGAAASPYPAAYDSVGVFLTSSQINLGTLYVNYFGTFQNITVHGATTCFLLQDQCNGHVFINCKGRGIYNNGFVLFGAYGNYFHGGFLELPWKNGVIAFFLGTKLLPGAPHASSLESVYNHIDGYVIEFGGSGHTGIWASATCSNNYGRIRWNANGNGIVANEPINDFDDGALNHYAYTNFRLGTQGSARGLLKINGAGGDTYHYIGRDTAGSVLQVENTHASSSSAISASVAAEGDGTATLFAGSANAVTTINIRTNGNIQNANNSYGAISDARLKDVVGPSGSQWDDVKFLAANVKKYTLKADGEARVQIGWIAQDIEGQCPGLVTEIEDRTIEGEVIGSTKTVSYSVANLKAIKALGEALERIELLESKVRELEAQ